jgi:hypothetical protein
LKLNNVNCKFGLCPCMVLALIVLVSCCYPENRSPIIPLASPATPAEPAAPSDASSVQNKEIAILPNQERNVVIDHKNWNWFADRPLSISNKLSFLKIYFEYASVGGNIMDGLQILRNTNASKYPLKQVAADEVPPPRTSSGTIYGNYRENSGWAAKVSDFAGSVKNGWHDPVVLICMNKFCWIDQDASVSVYANSMAELENNYPRTKFIYFTMPLSTETNLNAIRRAQFNTGLREWIATRSGKYLFDLADIESTSPDGERRTFIYNGTSYENMTPSYTSDGGHLNKDDRVRAATGLYSLFGQMVGANSSP